MNGVAAWLLFGAPFCLPLSRTCPGPETQALRAKYRGFETEVLKAKCNNTRVYCTSLCKNTVVVRPFYLFEVTTLPNLPKLFSTE